MKTITTLLAVCLLIAPAALSAGTAEIMNAQPLRFEPAAESGSMFVARGMGYRFLMRPTGIVMSTGHGQVRIDLPGGALEAVEPLPFKANYLIGSDSKAWRVNVPTYRKVAYRSAYPGVDVVFYGQDQTLEYDIVAAPGSHPAQVAFQFQGADNLHIGSHGELVLGGGFTLKKPHAYQEVNGGKREVAATFSLRGPHAAGFSIGEYDRTRPLVIDPVITFATYVGSKCYDDGRAVASSSAQVFYIAGYFTTCGDPLPGAFQPNYGGGDADAFVARFSNDSNGKTSAGWITYLGGTGEDLAYGLAADGNGNVWVAGQTKSPNFPITTGAQGSTPSVAGFISKIDATGSRLLYSARYGGTYSTSFRALALGANSSLYATASVGTPYPPDGTGTWDVMVMKLDSSGNRLGSFTFGGSNHSYGEEPTSISVDTTGAAYVCGATNSTSFPVTPGAFQSKNLVPGYTGYVAKVSADASKLVWATYLGGTNQQSVCNGIAVNKSGEPWVTGWTDATDFGSKSTTIQPKTYNRKSVFVVRLKADGSDLAFVDLPAGAVDTANEGNAITLDGQGNAFVTGAKESWDFPIDFSIGQPGSAGFNTPFLMKYGATGRQWSTNLGGNGWGVPRGIAIDAAGSNVYIAGATMPSDKFVTQGTFGGGTWDAFIAKVNLDAMPNWAVITSVVNGASFQKSIASGTWITVFGSGLAAGTRSWAAKDFTDSGKRLPTNLDGVQLMVNNRPALISYISPTQINALAPSDSYTGLVNVSVVSPGGSSSQPYLAALNKMAPAFFTWDGNYIIAHVGNEFIGPVGLVQGVTTRPARVGETITVYGTGFGPANPAYQPELLVEGYAPLPTPPAVAIGAAPASVQFAGQIGSGLYQFNIVVPNVTGNAQIKADMGSGGATQPGLMIPVTR